MEIIFTPGAKEDIKYWKLSGNNKIMSRITTLINSIEQTPFTGIGKPEALKYESMKWQDSGRGELLKNIV